MQTVCSLPQFTSRCLGPAMVRLLSIPLQGPLHSLGLYAQRIWQRIMCTSDIQSAVNWYPQSTLDLNLSRQKLTLYWHLGWHSIYTQLAISRVLINSYEHHINQHLMACMWKFILKLSTNWRLRCWLSLDRVSIRISLSADWDVNVWTAYDSSTHCQNLRGIGAW